MWQRNLPAFESELDLKTGKCLLPFSNKVSLFNNYLIVNTIIIEILKLLGSQMLSKEYPKSESRNWDFRM